MYLQCAEGLRSELSQWVDFEGVRTSISKLCSPKDLGYL